MKKVVVGMSGGVDSAVAAYLLQKEGYEVIGVTLKTWEGENNRCCEIEAARQTARKLNIEFHTLTSTEQFAEYVIKPFKREYKSGRTPNPCVTCNRYVKWARLAYFADVVGAEFVATGHYARIIFGKNKRFAVTKAADASKDQSYMLYKLTQEQLRRTIFPLGNLTKKEVRQIAAQIGREVAQKSDSQEICFVTEGNYTDFVGGESKPGNFVDVEGNILGRHRGIIHYTVGQRKGLGIALGYPAYVQKIIADTDEVVLGGNDSLYEREIFADDLNFMNREDIFPGEKITAKVKIRYRHDGEPAIIEKIAPGTVKITFARGVRAPTPGQAAVFYDERDAIIGGGTINSKFK